jgi:hypothetical protein
MILQVLLQCSYKKGTANVAHINHVNVQRPQVIADCEEYTILVIHLGKFTHNVNNKFQYWYKQKVILSKSFVGH